MIFKNRKNINNIKYFIILLIFIPQFYLFPSVFSVFNLNIFPINTIEFPLDASTSPKLNNGIVFGKESVNKVFALENKVNKLLEDTSGNKENRISKIHTNRGDELIITLEITDNDPNIQFAAYNLLGKVVIEPRYKQGFKGSNEFKFDVSALPNGIYLCVLQGKNFRLKEKFIISR